LPKLNKKVIMGTGAAERGFDMGLFSKQPGKKKPRPRGDSMNIYVKCDRCGEIIKTHIIKGNEIVPTYSEEGPAYFLRKELIGAKCPNRVLLTMEFDEAKRIISRDVSGGTFQEMTEL
jgi:hypothetical protein